MTDYRFAQVLQLLDGIDGRLDGLSGAVAGLAMGQTQLGNRLDAVEGRLDKIEGRLGKIEARLDKIEGWTLSVDKRLSTLADGRSEFGRFVDGLHTRVVRLEGSV